MNYKCPICDCHLYNVPLVRLAHLHEHNAEGETITVAYHASCLLGGSQISNLASMANSLGYDVQEYLRDTPENKRDGKWEQLFDDAEALMAEAGKWIEPEG